MHAPFKQAGFALPFVLWILVLLMLMVTGYSKGIRTETRLAAYDVQSAKARALASSGIWIAVANILARDKQQSLQANEQRIPFGGGEIRIRVQDEAGLIDLNTARPEVLDQLLRSAGAADADRPQLLAAILDWRDADGDTDDGAEDAAYAGVGRSYGAKDGPFNSVPELRLVLGMTEPVFRAMQSALTVHSGQRSINPAVSSKATLAALGADPAATETFVGSAQRSKTDAKAIGIDVPLSGSQGRTFTVTSVGAYGDVEVRLDVTLRPNPRTNPPFNVLDWQEGRGHDQT